MRLADLLSPLLLYQVNGDSSVEVTGIQTDSRKVKSGDLFVCLPGFTVDGHDFAPDAVRRGASVVLGEKRIAVDVPCVVVPDSRRALAVLADAYFGRPTSRLRLIGVTGTNGKTTVTHLLDQILCDAGYRTGRIGTINRKIGDRVEALPNTTPDVLDLQESFYRMLQAGCGLCDDRSLFACARYGKGPRMPVPHRRFYEFIAGSPGLS